MPKRTKASPKPAHALLPHLHPSHTTTATQFPLHSRHLQLRSNVLLISRHPIPQTPSPATHTVMLTPATPLRRLSATAVLIRATRFTFRTPDAAAAFLAAARAAALPRARYERLSTLGAGASGTVHLVRHPDGRLLAMKQIPAHEAFYSDAHLARLINERLALSQARRTGSPFIVKLVDAFESDDHLCLVTELAALGDLHAFVSNAPARRLPESVARHLFAEIVLGLKDLHRMGFLYRDLKLNNLLLTEHGHVKLADFGLAKRMNVVYGSSYSRTSTTSRTSVASDASTITSSNSSSSDSEDEEDSFRLLGRTKSFVGTRRYMSPEHLISGHGSSHGYGAPADMWALGVSLYVMLTGAYPFGNGVSSGNSAGLFHAIKRDELRFPEYVSKGARDMIARLLERDPLERAELRDVMMHPWMKVDWWQVREDAREEVVREEVVRLARGSGEKRLEKVGRLEKVVISECSVEEGCPRRRGDGGRLLGFGFVESE